MTGCNRILRMFLFSFSYSSKLTRQYQRWFKSSTHTNQWWRSSHLEIKYLSIGLHIWVLFLDYTTKILYFWIWKAQRICGYVHSWRLDWLLPTSRNTWRWKWWVGQDLYALTVKFEIPQWVSKPFDSLKAYLERHGIFYTLFLFKKIYIKILI